MISFLSWGGKSPPDLTCLFDTYGVLVPCDSTPQGDRDGDLLGDTLSCSPSPLDGANSCGRLLTADVFLFILRCLAAAVRSAESLSLHTYFLSLPFPLPPFFPTSIYT